MQSASYSSFEPVSSAGRAFRGMVSHETEPYDSNNSSRPIQVSQLHGEHVPDIKPQDIYKGADGRRWRILSILAGGGLASYLVQEITA